MGHRLFNILPRKIKWSIQKNIKRLKTQNTKYKIFGIGANKTGTTSLKLAMEELGYVVGHQRSAEYLLKDWANREFDSLINYCNTGDFFQDVPFSLPFTYIILDQAFPNSKFILTVRDSAEQWYESLVKFHSKKWGNGKLPSKEILENVPYIYKGWAWELMGIFDTKKNDIYNRKKLMHFYNVHIDYIKYYFKERPDDILILNVAEANAFENLCDFLNVKSSRTDFPWANKTIKK